MIKEFLSASAPLKLEIYGMVVFLFVFSVIVFWVFRKSGKAYYSKLEQLPLNKEIEL